MKLTPDKRIWSPSGSEIDRPLMVHEETHRHQQFIYGVEQWWNKYCEEKDFRLEQELEAYTNQYREFCRMKKDVKKRAYFLAKICQEISGSLYGNIITVAESRKKIIELYNLYETHP